MPDAPLKPTPLEAALEAHARGFTPVSLKPEHKAPTDSSWQTRTYEDTDAILTAFRSTSEDLDLDPTALNLGLALGAKHGDLVNIDIDHYKALGLAESILPETAMRSGRPGRPGAHYWYRVEGYDPGIRPHKLPSGAMVIEYRGGGGQTVIPPSIHPEGESYEWWGEPWGGAEGPRVLTADGGRQLHGAVLIISLLVTLSDGWPQRGSRHGAYLALVGGLLRDADEDGRPRPHPWWDVQVEGLIRRLAEVTHDADGAETRVAETIRTTRKKILKGDAVQGWPTLASIIGDDHVSKALGYIEQLEELLGVPRSRVRREADETPPAMAIVQDPAAAPAGTEGDDGYLSTGKWETAAERDVEVAMLPDADRDPLRERLNEWEPLDLGPYLRGGVTPPEAGLLHRTDGLGLFYLGRVNSLYGEGGSGKTLLALHTAAEVMARGENVMLIDFEDEPHNTLARFQALNVDLETVGKHFAYLRPESAALASMQVDRWGNNVATVAGRRNEEALAKAIARWDPAVIIVDGTTTLYRIHGQDTNAGGGTDIIGGWLRRLTDNGERTVILIDHTSKTASPGSTPVGSQHKIAMIQGTALHVFATTKPRKGTTVQTSLYVGKDRPGVVAEGAVETQALLVAEVTFNSTGSHLVMSVDPPGAKTVPVDIKPSQAVLERQTILDVLQGSPGVWMSASEIRLAGGLNITPRQWAHRIQPLLDGNVIEKSGKDKGTRYRADAPSDD